MFKGIAGVIFKWASFNPSFEQKLLRFFGSQSEKMIILNRGFSLNKLLVNLCSRDKEFNSFQETE